MPIPISEYQNTAGKENLIVRLKDNPLPDSALWEPISIIEKGILYFLGKNGKTAYTKNELIEKVGPIGLDAELAVYYYNLALTHLTHAKKLDSKYLNNNFYYIFKEQGPEIKAAETKKKKGLLGLFGK